MVPIEIALTQFTQTEQLFHVCFTSSMNRGIFLLGALQVGPVICLDKWIEFTHAVTEITARGVILDCSCTMVSSCGMWQLCKFGELELDSEPVRILGHPEATLCSEAFREMQAKSLGPGTE